MKALVINTYGGSLLLGATALGCEIVGSYEDTGFGLPIQQANFPDLDFRPMRKDWPDQDLSETFVIAHPPCSAFSVMNASRSKKGVDSAAFACTKSVLQYAVDNKAVGVAIESVVGALAGAWHIHQHYADRYGYNLYRVLENGTMFGAQWRDRFWVVYLKKGVASDVMPWTLTPKFQSVRQVLEHAGGTYNEGPSPAGLDIALEKMRNRFVEEAGCDAADLAYIFNENPTKGYCSVDERLADRKFPNDNRWEVCKKYVTKFASGAMVILDPDSFCPVLLGGSHWYLDGRNLSEMAYKRLMGFPADYVFPEQGRHRAEMRTYLSKGVMPPIAEWVLEQVSLHLGFKDQKRLSTDPAIEPYVLEAQPNSIVDFRMRKRQWGWERPILREFDERQLPQPEAALDSDLPRPSVSAAPPTSVTISVPEGIPTVARPPAPVVPRTRTAHEPRPPRAATVGRSRSAWNSPEIEESLKETLFVRPNTADAYALYESHTYHRMGVKADDVLLDLGGHIGCVASRAALLGARVISVEAEPDNFELLKQNTQTFTNVEVIHGAVYGGTKDNVTLHRTVRRRDDSFSTGTHSVEFVTRGDAIEVPRVDFRKLLNEHRPTVIKCDVEGSELSLDWTDLPSSVRSLGIEFHHRGGKFKPRIAEIVEQLAAQGFEPVHKFNQDSNFGAIIGFFARAVTTEAPEVPQAIAV